MVIPLLHPFEQGAIMQHAPSHIIQKSARPSVASRRLATATVVLLSIGAASSLVACGSDDDASTSDTTAESSASTTDGPSGSTTVPTGVPVIDPGDGGDYAPEIDPADFTAVVDNPYMPLPAGTRWVYEGGDGEETEHIEVTVTDEEKVVMGVTVVVVRDTVTDADGELVEDTKDWFAQDAEGNVWYFGEETAEYEDGEIVSTHGAWEAGVDGAQPGIVMEAAPAVGDAYRQEFYAGEAEDLAEVVRVGESVSVPTGDYDDVIVIKEWNPFEPETVEEKSYAPGIGVVLEEKVAGGTDTVELIEFEPGT